MRAGAILALCLASAGAAEARSDIDADAYVRPQRLVGLADGRRMNLYCTGAGSPTVVLDGGLGETSLTWARVQPRLARLTRVCSYDRAGAGFSDRGPFPRDAEHITADLWALLSRASEPGPYVMVGHSLTGQTMRLFISRHLDEVAGAVLVDPAIDHMEQRLAKAPASVGALVKGSKGDSNRCMRTIAAATTLAEKYKACGGPPPKMPGYPDRLTEVLAHMYLDPGFARTGLSESEAMNGVNASQIDAGQRPYGDLPLVVLTATRRGEEGTAEQRQGMQDIWLAAHQDIARLSTLGRDVTVADADHFIQLGKPEAVIEAVRVVVETARRTGRNRR
jgi:pimeloyl-ACP methyl ester carboxylesterase